MRFPAVLMTAVVFSTSALAQTQQAGSEAATNADETFQKLIEKCDDTDALVLRARIRLAIGRLDDQAVIEDLANQTNKALSVCGEGNVDEAKAELKKTLDAADAEVAKKFDQDGTTPDVKPASSDSQSDNEDDSTGKDGEQQSPWWKFW